MNLAAVMDEIATKLKGFTGTNIFPYPVDELTPPAGCISYPERVIYNVTYGGGEDMFEGIPVYLIADRADKLEARNKAAVWLDRNSNKSVYTFLDKENYNSCDSVTVKEATFDTTSFGGVQYLVVMFDLDVVGQGA